MASYQFEIQKSEIQNKFEMETLLVRRLSRFEFEILNLFRIYCFEF